jgi:hypothetical protein
MTLKIRTVYLLIGNHMLSWCIVFLLFVGFKLSLAPSYFYLGWSFSGGELPSLIWFYSWAAFLFLMLAYFSIKHLLGQRRLTCEAQHPKNTGHA